MKKVVLFPRSIFDQKSYQKVMSLLDLLKTFLEKVHFGQKGQKSVFSQ